MQYLPSARKKIEHYSYGLSDRIGKGYSSVVYRGRNDQTNETVAIKVIDLAGIHDDFGKEMLDCEIQALKTLHHPNILKCYDVFSTANNCYIITELCNDGDLAGLLSKRRRMSETETVGYLKEIVSGFIEIAEKGFLHRDLKLANIFLNNGVAKIADFGFAKKNRNPGQKEKYNVGSPLYMSPEALKKNIYSVKNDIWSIGVLLYELLHGETPWECKTEKELMDKIVRVPVTFTVKASEDLKNFIKSCLEVDQNKRMSLQGLKICAYLKNHHLKQQVLLQNNSVIPLGKLDLNKKASQNKQNQASSELPRAILDKNNQTIVQYINHFRLLFKITSSLSQHRPSETQLINSLSNEILDRVGLLKSLNASKPILPLDQPEKYLNETLNPAIKKYKIVIGQYYKKYNAVLKRGEVGKKEYGLEEEIMGFLKREAINEKEVVMWHWMVEFVMMPKEIKRDYLEGVIEPKNKPTIDSVQSRLKLVGL